MELQQRLYDVHDLWELGLQDERRDKDYELIDGAIIEMTKPGGRHGQLVNRLGHYLYSFVEANKLGYVTTETGYFPEDYRYTMLAPDLAFIALVSPAAQCVEALRMQEDGSFKHEALELADILTGEEILPGFQLGLSVLFA